MADTLSPQIAALLLAQQRKQDDPAERSRRYGQLLMQQGMATTPVQSPLEGLARALQGGLGGFFEGAAEREQKAKEQATIGGLSDYAAAKDDAGRNAAMARLLQGDATMVAPFLMQQIADQRALGVAQRGLAAQPTIGGTTMPGAGGGAPAQGGQPPLTIDMTPLPQGQTPQGGGFANNVGNIRAAPGVSFPGAGAPQNGFMTFGTPQEGVNAARANLGAYVQQNPQITVAQAISKWAPPNENNTQGYISRVAEGTGINPGIPLAEVLRDPAVAAQLLDAMTRVEKGGLPPGVTADTFMAATTPGGRSGGVGGPVVGGTQPNNVQGPVIPEGMVALARSSPADLTRLADDLASPDVNVQVRARDILTSRLGAEFMSSTPLPIISSMARQAVASAGGGSGGAAPGTQVAQGSDSTTATGAPQIAPRGTISPTPEFSPQALELQRQAQELAKTGTVEALTQARALQAKALEAQAAYVQERSKTMEERRYKEGQTTEERQYKAPQQAFENATTLRKDFESQPPVKAYRVVVPMLESAKDAATRPTRAADINLIYAFAKLMDPDSVVRESETGMVTASASVSDRLQGLIGQLNGGQMLQPETRQRLIAELQSRFNSLEQSYKEIEKGYAGMADRSGLNRDDVIVPIRPAQPGKPQTSAADLKKKYGLE